jgi:hypothetical protein
VYLASTNYVFSHVTAQTTPAANYITSATPSCSVAVQDTATHLFSTLPTSAMLGDQLSQFLFSFFYGTILVMISALLANFLGRFLSRRDPLGDIPGPFMARWTSLWLAYQARMGRRYLAVDEAHMVCPF